MRPTTFQIKIIYTILSKYILKVGLRNGDRYRLTRTKFLFKSIKVWRKFLKLRQSYDHKYSFVNMLGTKIFRETCTYSG